MLPRSKKQKGKWLEKKIAEDLKKIFSYVFSRADSGSGKHHKEDVTLPNKIPLFIECKNQAELKISEWWKKVLLNCPKNKYPVLIWKQNYERDFKVMMFLDDFLSLLGNKEVKAFNNIKIMFFWSEFLSILKKNMETIYDIYGQHYDEVYNKPEFTEEDIRLKKLIEPFIVKPILDVGCGTGLMYGLLNLESSDYIGLDTSSTQRATCNFIKRYTNNELNRKEGEKYGKRRKKRRVEN